MGKAGLFKLADVGGERRRGNSWEKCGISASVRKRELQMPSSEPKEQNRTYLLKKA